MARCLQIDGTDSDTDGGRERGRERERERERESVCESEREKEREIGGRERLGRWKEKMMNSIMYSDFKQTL